MNKEKFFEELQKHFQGTFKNFVFKSLRTKDFKKVFEPFGLPKTTMKFSCEPLTDIVSNGKKSTKLPKCFDVVVNQYFVIENNIETDIKDHKGQHLRIVNSFEISSFCTEKSNGSTRWTAKEFFLVKPFVFDTFENLIEIIKDTKFENY